MKWNKLKDGFEAILTVLVIAVVALAAFVITIISSAASIITWLVIGAGTLLVVAAFGIWEAVNPDDSGD